MTINDVEKEILSLYTIEFSFSDNLIKYEDNILKGKYDHNYFEYNNDFTKDEFNKAINYQKDRNDDFIKFFGRTKLKNTFGMEEGITLTMELENKDTSSWKQNNEIEFRKPNIDEVIYIDLKHYKDIFGEEFTINNVKRLCSKQEYLGAYINNKLVGIAMPYINNEYVVIDKVLVDEDYRNKYICTSMFKYIVNENKDKKIILHADEDDTPKNLYSKLGFKIVDKTYSYLLTKITDQKNGQQ